MMSKANHKMVMPALVFARKQRLGNDPERYRFIDLNINCLVDVAKLTSTGQSFYLKSLSE